MLRTPHHNLLCLAVLLAFGLLAHFIATAA
jgi:hypothetical protein